MMKECGIDQRSILSDPLRFDHSSRHQEHGRTQEFAAAAADLLGGPQGYGRRDYGRVVGLEGTVGPQRYSRRDYGREIG